MKKREETSDEFMTRLKSLPDPNLNDPQAYRDFGERLRKKIEPEMKEIETEKKKNLGRAFTRVIH